jgi:hypothetical protein
MSKSKRDVSESPLPATLVYSTALTCAAIAGIAVQIELSRAGFDLVGVWEPRFFAQAMQLRTTGPWWAIAGAGFAVSGTIAAALSRLPLPWRRFRVLRWVLGTAIVALLADIGHHSAGLPGGNMAGETLNGLAGLALAALMGIAGAYLTVRR